LNEILLENPQYLAMHERALPLTGGYSFAHITHTQRVSALACATRHAILELISQHFEAVGMYRTAEILARESGHKFQNSPQPWERTDLHLLASIAVGHREDAWNLPPDVDHSYVEEIVEEDFFASPYREDKSTISDEFYNPTLNVVYDSSGSKSLPHIERCSLKRFVVYFATAETVDNDEFPTFFLSLPSITSATHFLDHLVTVYDMTIDPKRGEKVYSSDQLANIPRNILNFIKNWTQYHIGKRTAKLLTQFLNRILVEEKSKAVHRHIPSILRNLESAQDQKFVEMTAPTPAIRDPHVLFKPSLCLLDPEPLEVARQLTLIYHDRYRSIHSLEFMISISARKITVRTPTFAQFFHFGDYVTQLFAETFLKAGNKEAAYARLCEIVRCLAQPSGPAAAHCSNWDAISCVVRFLMRDDILTLAGLRAVPPELAALWTACGAEFKTGNRAVYDEIIRKQAESWTPTIPNMQVELKSGDKESGNQPDLVGGLVNWAKFKPLAARCKVLSIFQRKGYSFIAVPQIQKIILKGTEFSAAQIEEKLDEQVRLLPKD
jgi:hypothetical protein